MFAGRLTGRGARGNTGVDDDSEPSWDVLLHVLYGHAWGIRAFSEAANAVTQKLSDSERPGSRKDSGRFAFGFVPGRRRDQGLRTRDSGTRDYTMIMKCEEMRDGR
jgi:hypothetical protein